MNDLAMPWLRAAIPFCMALLLTACGSHASDEDAGKLPDPRGAAGAAAAGASGGGARAGGGGATSGGDDGSDMTQQDSDDAGGDDSGSAWPAVRDVPAGTLAWTVVYKGSGTTRNSEATEVVVLQRKLEGHAHMVGTAANTDEAPPATPMDEINKAMDACGDDSACQQKVTMRMMAMARKDPAALERGMRNALAEAWRDTTWVADTCTAVGEADDTSTWRGMTEGGIMTGHGTRGGKRSLDDCAMQVAEGDSRPRLVADDNTKTYKLALPPGLIRVPATFEGKVEQSLGRDVQFPALVVEGIRYARLDRPLKGSATLHMGSDRGLYSESWSMPLTETVSWTFTPDPR